MRYIGHTLRVLGLSIIFAVGFLFRRLGPSDTGPRLLRWYLQTCGGAFIKVGQLLAMRYDLLPATYCDALTTLLDRLPAFPVAAIIQVLEADLQVTWTAHFQELDSQPLGSASVAQVHRAVLYDGTPVAVKVMRPGVERRFRIDFINIRLAARALDLVGLLGSIEAAELAEEFIRLTEQEFDFRREARYAQRLHELMSQDEVNHYAPRIYFELCGPHVITMELLEGVWLYELLAAVKNDDQARLLAWAELGIIPEQVGRLILRSVLTQCYRHRFFHADPHAGNLILLDGGTLGYIDFGLVGWLDERAWEQQFRLYENLANARLHAAYETILSTMEPLPVTNRSRFEMELKALLQDWILAINSNYATTSEKSSAFFFFRLFDIVRRSHLTIPSGIMRLNRALIISDAAILELAPQLHRLAFLREFFDNEARRLRNAAISDQFASETINRVLVEFMRSPYAAWSLLDWASRRVPNIWRDYRQQLTRSERAFVVFLRYGRLASLVLALIVVLGKGLGEVVPPTSSVAQFAASLGSSWWLIGLGSIGMSLLLGHIIALFISNDY
ncbi:MAG TPA: AarF/UbiB family protein [Aggregatilineales bacterium]|nr:AarF/UbiB family protein [Aggregatilineales bacterium]